MIACPGAAARTFVEGPPDPAGAGAAVDPPAGIGAKFEHATVNRSPVPPINASNGLRFFEPFGFVPIGMFVRLGFDAWFHMIVSPFA